MPILADKPIGKFRKLLREESILKKESKILKPYLKFLETSFQNNSLSSVQIISLFVILYQCFRVKEKPFQRNPIHLNFSKMANHEFPQEFDFISSLQLGVDSIEEFLQTYSFRYLPNSIREILLNLFLKENKLILITNIPTSKEMLSLQATGRRYITIDFQKATTGELIEEKRDAFEFVLHDLEHAHYFFKLENEPQKQIDFYKSIELNYHLLEPLIENNEQFKDDLEYCISDMNSHPEHLSQYFKAILIKYFLFKNKKAANEILTKEELAPMNEILNCIFPVKP
jgi:hypothetical protein